MLDLNSGPRPPHAAGPSHTRGDTGAFVEGDRVLFSGNMVQDRAQLLSVDPQ
jgi:hypothetical protein